MKIYFRRFITPLLLTGCFLSLCGIDACEKKYSISGIVSGDAREGVSLTLLGDSIATSATDAEGNYIFEDLVNGTYKIKINKSGYAFLPINQEVSIADSHKTGINFTATETEELNTIESITNNMISLSGGTFQMGCTEGDTGCAVDELPRHEVTLFAFEIGRYEVTQGQWEVLTGSNPALLYGYGVGADYPVYAVSRDHIQDFIVELDNQTGKNFRLCTEAEWEYAARAGTMTLWSCGQDQTCVYDIAWYDVNSSRMTHPVGQNAPNAWGLYDMSGNVSEWVADGYAEDYYSISPQKDPQGPVSAENGVNRGGNWVSSAERVRPSYRYQSWSGNSMNGVGFRLCADK